MEERIKNLEIEIAYLRKEISSLTSLIKNLEIDNHLYLTNVYYSKNYLDNFNDKFTKE